ncbi:unnamed protein product [Lactuca saligna]|uniref:Uncharacterized protein n=1 Tax=Lactuca saligna TaxID=75948 RepID=A0AA36E4N4_LACSI|nr:unnamed protein product [Lactuca saligna]
MLLVYCLVGDAEKETKMESDDREALLVKQIARMSNRPPTTLCGSFLVVGDHQSRGKGSSLIDGLQRSKGTITAIGSVCGVGLRQKEEGRGSSNGWHWWLAASSLVGGE